LGEGGTGGLHYVAPEGQVYVTFGIVETSNKLIINVRFQFQVCEILGEIREFEQHTTAPDSEQQHLKILNLPTHLHRSTTVNHIATAPNKDCGATLSDFETSFKKTRSSK
jgi:hypothetical protein